MESGAASGRVNPRLLAYQLLLPKLQGQLQLISGGVLIVVEGIRWDLHLKVGADPGVHPVDCLFGIRLLALGGRDSVLLLEKVLRELSAEAGIRKPSEPGSEGARD